MPYEGELATMKSLTRLAGHPRVQAVLRECRERESHDDPDFALPQAAACQSSGWLPDWVIALDGSSQQAPVANGYPGAEVCYMTIVAVMLDVKRMRELDQQRPVDPREFRRTQETGSLDCVLPGCNIVFKDELSAKASFRRAFFEEMGGVSSTEGGETLLETYEALLARKPKDKLQLCPYERDCGGRGDSPNAYVAAPGRTLCTCDLRRTWYSTDATRIYMGLNPVGPSGAMYAEVMQVWERLYVINVIRSMLAKGWASSFARVAIVVDGPLAIFGHPAWLSTAITSELIALNSQIRRESGADLLMMGIEKTGAFVDHFDLLDKDSKTGKERLPVQTAYPLSNEYIRRNIVVSDGKPHGEDTYFGRKVFYKTKSGARVVATLPILRGAARDRDDMTIENYPRLPDAMSLLDSVVSSRFPNALAPIVAAHAEAAIPLTMGRKVLERLAKEMLGKGV